MESHLRIRSERFGTEERSVLVESLLRLFQQKDISITKRVNRWLFGWEDEENRFVITDKNEFVVHYIIEAFRRILDSVPASEETCSYPIKILQNFYIEHPHLVRQTLSHISLELLRYIFNFGSPPSSSLSECTVDYFEEILKVGRRFLSNLPSYYCVILSSLGDSFVEAVERGDEELAFEAVKYIDFCYINLMKHEHGEEEAEYVTIVLESLTQGLALIAQKDPRHMHRVFLKDAVLLIYNFLERRRGVIKINRKEEQAINQKYFLENGTEDLPPERVAFLDELRAREHQQEQRYLVINISMQQFFVQLGHIVRVLVSIQEY